jgi:vacuolar-type H+-ATPase subunit H
VKQIIEENVKLSMKDALQRARKIRASFGKKTFSDSTELLREDRER